MVKLLTLRDRVQAYRHYLNHAGMEDSNESTPPFDTPAGSTLTRSGTASNCPRMRWARTCPTGQRSGTTSSSPEPGGELAISGCDERAVGALIEAVERSIETRQPVTAAFLYETVLIEAPIHV
jgi:hypothetical protein